LAQVKLHTISYTGIVLLYNVYISWIQKFDAGLSSRDAHCFCMTTGCTYHIEVYGRVLSCCWNSTTLPFVRFRCPLCSRPMPTSSLLRGTAYLMTRKRQGAGFLFELLRKETIYRIRSSRRSFVKIVALAFKEHPHTHTHPAHPHTPRTCPPTHTHTRTCPHTGNRGREYSRPLSLL